MLKIGVNFIGLGAKLSQSVANHTTTIWVSDCVKSVQIRSYFWPIFSCIIRIRNNPLFEHFSRSVKAHIFQNPILHLSVFLWKQYIILGSYQDFCKLQNFCSCTPLLTLTSNVFLFKNLPTEIAIFIHVSYQIKCFSGDSFSLF